MSPLLDQLLRIPAVAGLSDRLGKEKVLLAPGIAGSSHAFFAALIRRLFPNLPMVVVADGVKSQELLFQDLETWNHVFAPAGCNPPPLLYFPSWEVLPHEDKLPHSDVISERLETLLALGAPVPGESPIVVASIQAMVQRTFPPKVLTQLSRRLRLGDQLDPLDFVEWLEDQGYEPEAKATQKGEISLRGGILDIYPPQSPWPVRLEFFGDELESIRLFDPHTQISHEKLDQVIVPPAGELVFLKHEVLGKKRSGGDLGALVDYLPQGSLVLFLNPASSLQNCETYLERVKEDDPFFLDFPTVLERAWGGGLRLLHLCESHDPAPFAPWAGASPGLAALAGEAVEWEEWNTTALEAFRPEGTGVVDAQIGEVQRRLFFDQIHRWMRQGQRVSIFCNNDGERDRFLELWRDHSDAQLKLAPGESMSSLADLPTVQLGALSRGFHWPAAGHVVVTDAEIFGRYKIQRARRLKSPHAAAARSALDIDFGDLEPGDHVVHLQHGVGKYLGLERLESPGARKKGEAAGARSGSECLVLEYAAPDSGLPGPKLYVPITEAHLVSKYIGTGKAKPALNNLGGGKWAKARSQAEHAVRDLAAELLKIQAARSSLPGHAFGSDTAWQREFESAFLYEETVDQLKAIQEAKRDMEIDKPMDRLVCGDVGYGKTEVAIRAAFKAVMGGKQVAILVPTTILAHQHWRTLSERMADYPIRVEQLSRFRTKGQQRKVLDAVAEGAVDIVVGTHRLIQDDVRFARLGLVVIDEEQRFGLLHKEKLKLMESLVDVLTLSATPIPRTLYLAMMGARDMSTIETPPQDRLPVETIISQFDERLLKEAIVRELNRGGQVYYLHNRVLDIHSVALKVKQLVPDARVVVGHGQMEARELEEVMAAFINGEADVLVSTTIIESGIDIPNANTIIIDRADRFGLSDLYQLRGRVGRHKHQAYAYLLLPRHAALLSDVRKRISAIKQYSSLGSGFKIAMRDLEIRGAGNLLGERQSGHITAVGFDLYCQLLKQSVSALKGEKPRRRLEVQSRIDFLALTPGEESAPAARPVKPLGSQDRVQVRRETASFVVDPFLGSPAPDEAPAVRHAAYIPESHVAEPRQRIELYRRLAQVVEKPALDALRAEIKDRFGPPPPALDLLFQLAEIKLLAADRSVTALETRGDKLMLTRNGELVTVGGKFPRLMRKEAKPRLNEIRLLLQSLQPT